MAAAALLLAIPLLTAGAGAPLQEPAPQEPAPQAPAPEAPAPFDRAAALAALVDLPTPEARRAQAAVLARGHGDELESWTAAMKGFGAFARPKTGIRTEEVDLRVLDRTESTELWVYVPTKYDPAVPAPLIVAFHGTGGSGQGMHLLWQKLADAEGYLVLAPSEAGENVGYRFSERERAAALAALRWMRRTHNVDENRIYATGISRGGHLTWDLALRHTDMFAAVAPCIGSPRLSLVAGQNNLRLLENVARLPIRDLQGSKDDAKMVHSVRLAFDLLERFAPRDAKLIEFADRGHDFDPNAVDWPAWFGASVRDPWPERVVRCTATKHETRAAWLEIETLGKGVDEVFRPEISESDLKRLDEDGQWRLVVDQAVERTARAAARRTAPGTFTLELTRVTKARIFLRAEDLANGGKIEVQLAGKAIPKKVRPDAKTLLEEFAERFDRTFLPVARIDVP